MPQLPAKPSSVLTMLLLTLLQTACATQSAPSVVACPTLPPAPAATQPPPLLPYSVSARNNIERWRKMLTDTPAIPKP